MAINKGIITIGEFEYILKEKPVYTDRNSLIDDYWMFHPRFKFLKTAKANSTFCDIGAGDGGLFYWRDMTSQGKFLSRPDLKMYAVDLFKGQLFTNYEDFQIGNLDEDKLKFDDESFDYVYMTHVFEHINNVNFVLSEMKRVLKSDGKIYIELPSPESERCPSRKLFVDNGFPVSTLNFFDDVTHKKTYEPNILLALFAENNYKVIEHGCVCNDFIKDELIYYGMKYKDAECLTYGMWLFYKWSDYYILEKSSKK